MVIYGGEVGNGQVQYICNKIMFIARKLNSQLQKYSKTIHKIFLEEIPLLLPTLEEPESHNGRDNRNLISSNCRH